MKVLIVCEESQRVMAEFLKRGHDAWSCDIKEASGDHPERHIVGDAIDAIYSNVWDLIIAFPPCTYLSNSGAQLLYPKRQLNFGRFSKGMKAREFFKAIQNAPCDKIVIENPTHSLIYNLGKESQVIQPFQYGHPYRKRTCLWVKGLPLLQASDVVSDMSKVVSWTEAKRNPTERSKTFYGVAKAMGEQWG